MAEWVLDSVLEMVEWEMASSRVWETASAQE
jgi:hypothetical protein